MSGARFGPLEIFANCDGRRCTERVMVWSGNPETTAAEIMADAETNFALPPGWTWRDGKTYCPKHSRHTGEV